MSNEKNENLQNVSFIHDSSLLLIRCMMSHIYSINFTKRIWLAVIPSLLQIHILSRVFKMMLSALGESNQSIRQPIREFLASVWKLVSAFARSFTAGDKINQNGKISALQETLLTLQWSIYQIFKLIELPKNSLSIKTRAPRSIKFN